MSRIGTAALAMALAAIALLFLVPAPASAEWTGSATLEDGPLRVDGMERFEVTVTNTGTEPMEVTAVSATVMWPHATYYQVFEGSAVVQPGESKTFASEPTRMPTTDPRTYPASIAVTARGADGAEVEKQFSGTVDLYVFSIDVAGIPEEILVPLALAGAVLLVTLLLFRFERVPGWPPFRSVPRWRRRS